MPLRGRLGLDRYEANTTFHVTGIVSCRTEGIKKTTVDVENDENNYL